MLERRAKQVPVQQRPPPLAGKVELRVQDHGSPRASLFFLLFVLTLPMCAYAQTTSVIEGTVRNTLGQAITGADITLSGPVLPREIKISSNMIGSYRLP